MIPWLSTLQAVFLWGPPSFHDGFVYYKTRHWKSYWFPTQNRSFLEFVGSHLIFWNTQFAIIIQGAALRIVALRSMARAALGQANAWVSSSLLAAGMALPNTSHGWAQLPRAGRSGWWKALDATFCLQKYVISLLLALFDSQVVPLSCWPQNSLNSLDSYLLSCLFAFPWATASVTSFSNDAEKMVM